MQTNVTEVTPEARATAVALFSAALYIGQTIGVAVASLAIDRTGAPPIFIVSALLVPVLGFGFAAMLRRK
jgi:predicted MFS family arabinose efflux permease